MQESLLKIIYTFAAQGREVEELVIPFYWYARFWGELGENSVGKLPAPMPDFINWRGIRVSAGNSLHNSFLAKFKEEKFDSPSVAAEFGSGPKSES